MLPRDALLQHVQTSSLFCCWALKIQHLPMAALLSVQQCKLQVDSLFVGCGTERRERRATSQTKAENTAVLKRLHHFVT